ncbi:hypothetical protein ACQRIT_006390 [Beauveria bassiana]
MKDEIPWHLQTQITWLAVPSTCVAGEHLHGRVWKQARPIPYAAKCWLTRLSSCDAPLGWKSRGDRYFCGNIVAVTNRTTGLYFVSSRTVDEFLESHGRLRHMKWCGLGKTAIRVTADKAGWDAALVK